MYSFKAKQSKRSLQEDYCNRGETLGYTDYIPTRPHIAINDSLKKYEPSQFYIWILRIMDEILEENVCKKALHTFVREGDILSQEDSDRASKSAISCESQRKSHHVQHTLYKELRIFRRISEQKPFTSIKNIKTNKMKTQRAKLEK